MSEYIHKSHNVSVLMYHFVCPTKYRKIVFDNDEIDKILQQICLEIENRYEIKFLEIGSDKDHVHFLIQSVPTNSPKKIIQTVKSILARQIFEKYPEIKTKLWGGEFWSKGYFVSTVEKHGDENIIAKYVKNQGNEDNYSKIHSGKLALFPML